MTCLCQKWTASRRRAVIRAQCPNAQVLMLSSAKDEDLIKSGLQAGAIGYLLKNATVNELADAVALPITANPRCRPP